MKNGALVVSGLIFLVISVIHVIRYVRAWDIIIANHTVPLQVSIYGAIITLILAIWMFVAASK